MEAGFPALLVRRVTLGENGEPFEYRKSIIRADQCRYSIELEGLKSDSPRGRKNDSFPSFLFFKIGTFTWGGGYAMLPLIKQK